MSESRGRGSSAEAYVRRSYRERMGSRFRSFVVSYKESDLWIGVDPPSWCEGMEAFVLERATRLRSELESYGVSRPEFLASLEPIPDDPGAPPIVRAMMAASAPAGVGPMAAVAGAVARFVGEDIEREYGAREIVVENGGDDWLRFEATMDIAVFAGASPLSERIGVTIPAALSPLGVCTSSGTVGPSFSFGRADAVMVACRDAALADAWATALGNIVRVAEDIETALDRAAAHPEIIGALIVKDDRMGLRGELRLKLFRG